MLLATIGALLAQVPSTTVYISPWKLVLVLVLFTGWALFAAWVNKDTRAVNTFQQIWNMIVLGLGILAICLWLFLPLYWAGFAAYMVINLGVGIAYVIHRNGLVVEEDKVLTAAHIKRLMSEGFRSKKGKKKLEVKERLRLIRSNKQPVTVPEEDIEREQFQLTQDLLFDAFWHRMSSLEIVPAGQTSKIRLVVDGVPSERDRPRPEGDAMLMYLKSIAGLSLEERRKPQRGKFFAQIGENKHELQVRTDGSTAGEKLRLRLVGPERSFKVPDIGLTAPQQKQLREVMDGHNGVVIVSAPPGNGLTTTVYSLARSHDAFLQNIQLIEFDRELDIDNITQITYVQSDERPFSADVLKIVRTDPDILILPEVRDRQTAEVVCNAAGHKQKIYVGMKANDALDALTRWIQTVAQAPLAAKTLLAVLNQRLVRKLCVACKTPYKPDPSLMSKLNLPADKVLYRQPEQTLDKNGNPIICQACQGTGFVGRTGIFVVLTVDDELRAAIRDGDAAAIKAAAMKRGSLSLQNAAFAKVLDGTTSIDEVVRATRVGAAAPAAAAKAAPAAGAAPAAKPAARPAPKPSGGQQPGGASAR